MRCGICGRKMQGATIRSGTYYRCTARTLAPGAATLAAHPATVNRPTRKWLAAQESWRLEAVD